MLIFGALCVKFVFLSSQNYIHFAGGVLNDVTAMSITCTCVGRNTLVPVCHMSLVHTDHFARCLPSSHLVSA